MAKYIITLGSNTPDKNERVAAAILRLKEWVDVVSSTPVYSSPDAYHDGRPPYANAIVVADGPEKAEEMLDKIFKDYERSQGRDRSSRMVQIDIDIVVRDTTILRPRDYSAPYFLLGLPLLSAN